MIACTVQGIARFFNNPMDELAHMRAATPEREACLLALITAMLVMVVIDFAYGPYAFPHTLEPGGKRDTTVFAVATVEVLRIFGVASVILIGTRHFLNAPVTVNEALWMTVPYALGLVGLEIIQMSAWFVALAFGVNLYGQMFLIGFGGVSLVLIASVRTLVPDRDWLDVLPLSAVAFFVGTFFTPVVLLATAVYLLIRAGRKTS